METPKSKRNRDTWLGEPTVKFIAIWREKQSDLKKIGPKKQLFQDWANRLKEEGVDKSAEQVQKKLENMKHMYTKYKPNCTGGTPPSWKYWRDVHEILQTSHYYNEEMATIMDSTETEILDDDSTPESSASTSIPDEVLIKLKKGSQKRKSVSEIVENQSSKFEQFLEESKRRHEERMEELRAGRILVQNRVEEIGAKAAKVLDLIEKKLNENQ